MQLKEHKKDLHMQEISECADSLLYDKGHSFGSVTYLAPGGIKVEAELILDGDIKVKHGNRVFESAEELQEDSKLRYLLEQGKLRFDEYRDEYDIEASNDYFVRCKVYDDKQDYLDHAYKMIVQDNNLAEFTEYGRYLRDLNDTLENCAQIAYDYVKKNYELPKTRIKINGITSSRELPHIDFPDGHDDDDKQLS